MRPGNHQILQEYDPDFTQPVSCAKPVFGITAPGAETSAEPCWRLMTGGDWRWLAGSWDAYFWGPSFCAFAFRGTMQTVRDTKTLPASVYERCRQRLGSVLTTGRTADGGAACGDRRSREWRKEREAERKAQNILRAAAPRAWGEGFDDRGTDTRWRPPQETSRTKIQGSREA